MRLYADEPVTSANEHFGPILTRGASQGVYTKARGKYGLSGSLILFLGSLICIFYCFEVKMEMKDE